MMTKEMLLEDHYIDDYVDDHVDREIEVAFLQVLQIIFCICRSRFWKNKKSYKYVELFG